MEYRYKNIITIYILKLASSTKKTTTNYRPIGYKAKIKVIHRYLYL